jgi:PAS domain S-box-containing protein
MTTYDEGTDRRRRRTAGQSAADTLASLPALVVLRRLPVPTVAVDRDGDVVFANDAFADMLGYETDWVCAQSFDLFCHSGLAGRGSARATQSAEGSRMVRLRHREGSYVDALMSETALRRSDDDVLLHSFQDVTEQLWTNARSQ